MRPCNQKQCGHNINGGCKACSGCGAPPNQVSTDCNDCLSCENFPGHLRWNDGQEVEKEAEKVIVCPTKQ